MKKSLLFSLALFTAMVFQSCVKDHYPELPGLEPVEPENLVYEVSGTINIINGYGEIFRTLPQPLQEGDMMLGYIYWDDDFSVPSAPKRIWRLLPEAVYFPEGVLSYKFEFTNEDYNFFIETTFDAAGLDPIWRTDLTFRAVILRGSVVNGRIDYSDYDAVMELIGATEHDVLLVE